MSRREEELSKIYRYAGRGFFMSYVLGVTGLYVFRGKGTPYFKNIVKHVVLCVGGSFTAALGAERLASEFYYNKLLI